MKHASTTPDEKKNTPTSQKIGRCFSHCIVRRKLVRGGPSKSGDKHISEKYILERETFEVPNTSSKNPQNPVSLSMLTW